MKYSWKKILPTGLSVAVLTFSASTAIAANDVTMPVNPTPNQPINAINEGLIEEEQESSFIGVTGVIQSVEDREDGMKLVAIESNEGLPIHFIVSEDTYVASDLEKGAEIIAFHDANLPVIMIYPPQYGAIAIADVENSATHKVDYFDENLVSSDGTLKLNLSEEVEILNKDGSAFEGEIDGHKLYVKYGASTRSIPEQTTPDSVIVLGGPDEADSLDPSMDAEIDGVSYAPVFGEIKDIQPHGTDEEYQLVTVVQEDDSIVNFVITQQTYVYNELEEGMQVVAFYDANAPAIMIYPPQYGAVAIAEVDVEEGRSFKVSVFDENLLSQDGSLVLRIGEDTEIVQQDGSPFDGDLAGRTLFIEYGIVALSHPAQTTPDTIVVLDENEVNQPETTDPAESLLEDTDSSEATEDDSEPIFSVEDHQIVVNNETIEAPAAFIDGDNVMLPLRTIAEAAGFELTWDHATKSTQLGDNISLQVGEMSYTDANGKMVQLNAAPVLVDGLTYVPLNFFRDVVHFNNAYVIADGIFINNEEKLQ